MKSIIYSAIFILSTFVFTGNHLYAQSKKLTDKDNVRSNVQVATDKSKTQSKVRITLPTTCSEGLILVQNKCVEKITLQGRLVYIMCDGGKMEYFEIKSDGTFGSRTTGPQTGQSCTGNWLHKTDIIK